MSWSPLHSLESQHLPPHCHPTSDFLHHVSSALDTCIPTPLAFLSTLLGTLSIISWLFAQLPQIYKNYALSSTAGLSIYFLVEWCLGDATNLLGALFTGQASWQVIVAGYYCFVDLILVFQWFWYEYFHHDWTVKSIWVRNRSTHEADDDPGFVEGVDYSVRSFSDADSIRSGLLSPSSAKSAARDIYSGSPTRREMLAADYRFPPSSLPDGSPGSLSSSARRMYRMPTGSSLPMPSPRNALLIACLVALCRASPLAHEAAPLIHSAAEPAPLSALDIAGTILSWSSTALYLVSRLPQLWKNYRRRSTSGLSPHLFAAAFFGNLFYASSIAVNPCAWYDMGPHGGHGWAGERGSNSTEWVLRALPFWLGAAGVLVLDGAMGVQFLLFGETGKVVIAEEVDRKRKRRRWKVVSGYMRGWVPSFVGVKVRGEEGRGLLRAAREQQRRTYGTASGEGAAVTT